MNRCGRANARVRRKRVQKCKEWWKGGIVRCNVVCVQGGRC
jgi:hypothetical protein